MRFSKRNNSRKSRCSAGYQIRLSVGSGKLSNMVSADTKVSPPRIAVAATILSNGSRWAHSSLPAYKAVSAVKPALTPPCSLSTVGRLSRQLAIPGHFPMRTFWPISNRLIGLTKTVSAPAMACLAPGLSIGSSRKLQTQACVSRRTCNHWPSQVRSSSSLIGSRKSGDAPTLPLRSPNRNPDCGNGTKRTTGLLPFAITTSSPRSAASISLESWLLAVWTEYCMISVCLAKLAMSRLESMNQQFRLTEFLAVGLAFCAVHAIRRFLLGALSAGPADQTKGFGEGWTRMVKEGGLQLRKLRHRHSGRQQHPESGRLISGKSSAGSRRAARSRLPDSPPRTPAAEFPAPGLWSGASPVP